MWYCKLRGNVLTAPLKANGMLAVAQTKDSHIIVLFSLHSNINQKAMKTMTMWPVGPWITKIVSSNLREHLESPKVPVFRVQALCTAGFKEQPNITALQSRSWEGLACWF
jgi:hypothetical protein